MKFKIGDLVIYKPMKTLEIIDQIRELHIITISMRGSVLANDKKATQNLFKKATDEDIKRYLSERVKKVLQDRGVNS